MNDIKVSAWDEVRDARLFPGGNPVIAHPPCRLWSQMRHLSTAPREERELALLAINQVRDNGGILEHPSGSLLWPTWLPLPGMQLVKVNLLTKMERSATPPLFAEWLIAVAKKCVK